MISKEGFHTYTRTYIPTAATTVSNNSFDPLLSSTNSRPSSVLVMLTGSTPSKMRVPASSMYVCERGGREGG